MTTSPEPGAATVSGLILEAKELINWIQRSCRRDDGLLCGWIDPSRNMRDAHHLLPDFGDWAPFFVYFGEQELVRYHVAHMPDHFDAHGILKAQQRRGLLPIVTAFEHTDLLLGLLDCASLGMSNAREVAESLLEKTSRIFHVGQGLHSYYMPTFGLSVPITSTVDATFIELLVQAHEVTRKSAYLQSAEELAHYFISLPFFRSYGLLPELSGLALGRRTISAQTMKHNTNALSALLELHRVAPSTAILNAIESWITASDVLHREGLAYFSVTRIDGIWVGDDIDIVPSVGLLDVLCDISHALDHEGARKSALRLGHHLLALQKDTGLVPRSLTNSRTHLDAQTDLIIAWEKLSSITGDSQFSLAAHQLFDAIRQYHRFEGGYVQSCESTTGKIVEFIQNTRYNALFLKPYLLYTHERDIYEDRFLTQLLKDR